MAHRNSKKRVVLQKSISGQDINFVTTLVNSMANTHKSVRRMPLHHLSGIQLNRKIGRALAVVSAEDSPELKALDSQLLEIIRINKVDFAQARNTGEITGYSNFAQVLMPSARTLPSDRTLSKEHDNLLR